MSTARLASLLDDFLRCRLSARNRARDLHAQLLDAFQSVRSESSLRRCNLIQGVTSEFASVQQAGQLRHRLSAPYFQLFGLMGKETDELLHSRILAWALSPSGTHSQGADLFRAISTELGLTFEFDCWDYHVRREYKELEARIDVVAYGRQFLIYFENKIGAVEGPDQTIRESRDMASLAKRLSIPPGSCLAVYLSPQRVEVTPPFRNVTWRELAHALQQTVDSIAPVEVRCFLSQWLKTLMKMGGNQ